MGVDSRLSVMDRKIVSAILTLWLLEVAVSQTNMTTVKTPPITQSQSEASDTSPPGGACSCPGANATLPPSPGTTAPPPSPALGMLTVRWAGHSCEGEVLLTLAGHAPSGTPRCVAQQGAGLEAVQDVLSSVCGWGRGCGGQPRWEEQSHTGVANITCTSLRVTCTVSPPPEPVGYKVATGLLCVLVLLVLLVQFTPRTVRTLQSRLSNRRQNRWIGPTQSVSYHRGKGENDTEKRLSYPALERLVVSYSREPSSNQNSEY